MSRPWQVGDIVERRSESSFDGFATQITAMVSAVQVASGDRFATVRWVYLGPWYEYKTQQDHEERGWRLVEPRILIPPGTPTHVFDDVPEDEPLVDRQGHPYT